MPSLFTVDQANRTLPLVRRIVEDVVRQYARWTECTAALRDRARAGRALLPSEVAALEREAKDLGTEIEGYIAELAGLGIEMKGLDVGLIDFPGQVDGRPVWLCWRLGEPSVQYWHELDAGFAGRQPLRPVATYSDSS